MNIYIINHLYKHILNMLCKYLASVYKFTKETLHCINNKIDYINNKIVPNRILLNNNEGFVHHI